MLNNASTYFHQQKTKGAKISRFKVSSSVDGPRRKIDRGKRTALETFYKRDRTTTNELAQDG